MANRPTVPQKQALRTYYIYDPGVADNLGQVPIKRMPTGQRVVMLTESQAAYWINTGAIGPVPLDLVQGPMRDMLHQLNGGRVTNSQGKNAPIRRTAIQDPNTAARALTEGYHPVTGKRMVSDAERNEVENKRRMNKQQRPTSFFEG